MSIRDCIKLVDDCDPDDAAAVRARVKELIDSGVPANEAWTEAAEMVMEDVVTERNEVAAEARNQGGYMEDVTLENLLNPQSYAVTDTTPVEKTETDLEQTQGQLPEITEPTPQELEAEADLEENRKNVDRWLRKPMRRLKGVEVVVLDKPSDAPVDVPAEASGWTEDGVIYMFRDNIESEQQAIADLEHEAVGHLGLEGVLGQKKFDELISDVFNIMTEMMIDGDSHPQIRGIQNEIRKAYLDEDGNYTLDRRQEAREILAHIANSKPRTGRLNEIYNKVVQWMREWAASLGLADPDMTMIEGLMNQATDYVTKYQPVRDEAPMQPTKEAGAAMIHGKNRYSQQEQLNRQIREQHHSIWTQAKNFLKRQLAPGGLLPRMIFDQKIKRDSELEAGEMDIKMHVWALERAFKKDFGKSYSKITEAEEQMISQAMRGGPVDGLPENTAVAVEAMRQRIDRLTKQYVQVLDNDLQDMIEQDNSAHPDRLSPETVAKIDLINTMTENLGEYVHRSYRAFDDEKWPNNVPSEVLEAARAYLEAEIMENDPKISPEGAQHRAQNIINDILKDNTAFSDMASFIRESKLGARDLSILKKRKQIAPEIRALLGEYTDPRLNYAKTITKMNRLIFNDRFLRSIKEQGMGTLFFEDDGDYPVDAYVKIAGASNEAYAPLNGLRTYPEVEQGLIDALGQEQMARWYQEIVKWNGAIKFGKTVLSPTTAARNWMSAAFFAIGNGHFNLLEISKSLKSANAYFTHKGEMLKYLRKLKQLGVVYDTPYAGEMMRLLDDTKMAERWVQGSMPAQHALDMAQKFYQFGDDFWKIVGFENEVALQMKYYNLPREQAEIKAAERIRNSYPTYSMTGKFINWLRRFPVAGTFVSFPSEMLRTGFNIVRYAAEDMKHSPELGARRITGLAIISGAMYAAQEMSKDLLDIDDDEDEAVRDQLPEWSRNSNLYYLSREGGNLRYLDLSFADPYNIWKRPFNAMMRDEPFEQQAKEAGLEFMGTFVGLDIGFGAIAEIWQNKKSSGGQVYSESDKFDQQAFDITEHFFRAAAPGIFSNIDRIVKAKTGQVSPGGRVYDIDDEIAALAGFRVSTLDPAQTLKYKGYAARDTLQDASRILGRTARDPNPIADRVLKEAFDRSMYIRQQAYKDLAESISAARRSGVDDKTIYTQLKAASISDRDARMLIKGKTPPYIPSPNYLMKEIKAQTALKGSEEAEQIKARRRKIIQYAKERVKNRE